MRALVLGQLLVATCAVAYIPATPTNDVNAVNQSDMSTLTMRWSPGSVFSNPVSSQLTRNHSRGFEQGALVHFSETNLTDQNSTTPWIALVNCDKNATNASQVDDIFTLARDRGACAALLYSLTSEACLINPEYADPNNFEQIMDIYATKSLASAGIIESQFAGIHDNSYSYFNATQLNNSADSVVASMNSGNITSPFIVASLRSANSTVSPNGTDTGPNSPSPSGGPSSSPNTGLAMIILYAITGCVSALFIVVILSGAIRAIRHPERYGPRAGAMNGGLPGTTPQSRTGGIGRAILDTFPIIKFGQTTGESNAVEPKIADVENSARQIEMTPRREGAEGDAEKREEIPSSASIQAGLEPEDMGAVASSSRRATLIVEGAGGPSTQLESDDSAQDPTTTPGDDVRPDAIGHETCPICIVDFQEGDDVRVLPCEGKHKFHQTCVDPWLLELSTSCPLCREDFHALESMIAGNSPEDVEQGEASMDAPGSSGGGMRPSRFSKYLRFARRSRGSAHETQHDASSHSDLPSSGT